MPATCVPAQEDPAAAGAGQGLAVRREGVRRDSAPHRFGRGRGEEAVTLEATAIEAGGRRGRTPARPLRSGRRAHPLRTRSPVARARPARATSRGAGAPRRARSPGAGRARHGSRACRSPGRGATGQAPEHHVGHEARGCPSRVPEGAHRGSPLRRRGLHCILPGLDAPPRRRTALPGPSTAASSRGSPRPPRCASARRSSGRFP